MGSAVNDTASSDTTIQMAVPVRSGKIARRSSGNFKTFNSSRSGAIRACSGTRAVFSFFTRLITWYALYSVLFRCPTHPTPDSPQICYSANTLKNAMRPHVQPYYDTYVFPFVQQYSPYIYLANKEYVTPTYEMVYTSYVRFGEPYISKGSEFAAREYNQILKPHLISAHNKLNGYYIVHLSPYVDSANKIWINDIKPTVEYAESKAKLFWKSTVMPTYNRVQPYVAIAYENGRYVAISIVAPVVKECGEKALGWGRGMWSEVVRPQVGRIRERLGGTNGNGAAVSSADLSSSSTQDASEEGDLKVSLSADEKSQSFDAADGSQELSKEEVKEIIENDLAVWKKKLNTVKEKVRDDLVTRIYEISDTAYLEKHVDVDTQIEALEQLVFVGFSNLKAEIVTLIKPLALDSSAEDKIATQDRLLTAVRNLGAEIRDKAKLFRRNAGFFIEDVYEEVSEATKEVLYALAGANNRGVDDLGMRWAKIDPISYKNWEEFRDLENLHIRARTEIFKTAQEHEQLAEITKWVADDWDAIITIIAENAADELKRIKDVGKRKIELADSSDNFDNVLTAVTTGEGSQKVHGDVEKAEPAAQDPKIKLEKGSAATPSTLGAAANVATNIPPTIDAIILDAISRVKTAAAKASEAIYGMELSQLEQYKHQIKYMGQEAVESVRIALYDTSKGAFKQKTETGASMASEAVERLTDVIDGAKQAAQSTGAKVGIADAEEEYRRQMVENAKRRINAAIEVAEESLKVAGTKAMDYAEYADEAFENAKIKSEL